MACPAHIQVLAPKRHPSDRSNAVKNPKFRAALVDVIREAGADGGCEKAKGALLYTVASKVGKACLAGASRARVGWWQQRISRGRKGVGAHEAWWKSSSPLSGGRQSPAPAARCSSLQTPCRTASCCSTILAVAGLVATRR